MIWREKERSRIRAVENRQLWRLLGIRRMDRLLNPQLKELCGVMKGLRKVFFVGLAILKEWRMIGLLKGRM